MYPPTSALPRVLPGAKYVGKSPGDAALPQAYARSVATIRWYLSTTGPLMVSIIPCRILRIVTGVRGPTLDEHSNLLVGLPIPYAFAR